MRTHWEVCLNAHNKRNIDNEQKQRMENQFQLVNSFSLWILFVLAVDAIIEWNRRQKKSRVEEMEIPPKKMHYIHINIIANWKYEVRHFTQSMVYFIIYI